MNITKYINLSDAESVKMKETIDEKGFRYFLEETLGLKSYNRLVNKIIELREVR